MSQRTNLNNLLDNLQRMEQLPNRISTTRQEIKNNLRVLKEQYENVICLTNHKLRILEEIDKNYSSLCKNEGLLLRLNSCSNTCNEDVIEELEIFMEKLGFNNYSVTYDEVTLAIEIEFNLQSDRQ